MDRFKDRQIYIYFFISKSLRWWVMADINPEMLGAFGPFAAIIAAFLLVFLVIFIALYIYYALALMTIAKKTNTEPAWIAWVPIANVYLMTKIGKLEWWWMLGFLIGIIPFLGGLLVLVWSGYLFWKIAEARGFEGWYGALTAIPLIGFIFVGIIAWGEPKKA
jgi:hypothetical protein